ncbi:transcriptional regulator [Alkalihalophilus lindianensis]|uniref:Transcriptional regulator n=1 Tax=Alkalihalophilus lindianensis TaxID=1630542 RepID=A0ABU3XFE4_9BACI|nr:transcriptional regulator [Alkalihalophilus lindianensis]MDV2686621.1 transcriptional regulator [Alkalihalophilus lindianensis]
MAINQKTLKRATFKHIEAELICYHETKKEIKRLRESIIYDTELNDNVGMGKNSYRIPSRPTEQIATRLIATKIIRNLVEISDAIESIYSCLDENQKKLIKMRYWSGRNRVSWKMIDLELNLGEWTVYRYQQLIIEAIAERIGWR